MTQLYEAGVQKVTAAAAGPIVTLVTGASARPDIREIGLFVSSAPASGPTVGMGRPAAIGSGTLTGTLGQATDFNDPASACTLTTSFGSGQPTAPASFFRRVSLPNAIGAGFIWTFDRNVFNIPPSANLVIWQLSALAVTYDVYVQWEE